MNYGHAPDFEVDIKGDKASITLPDIAKVDQKWLFGKLRIISAIRKYTEIKTIRFIEEYEKKEEKEEEEGDKEEKDKKPEKEDKGEKKEEKSIKEEKKEEKGKDKE